MLDAQRQENPVYTRDTVKMSGEPFLMNWRFIYKALDDVIDDLDPESQFFEIGSFAGKSLQLWLETIQNAGANHPMIVVDPYTPQALNNQDSIYFLQMFYSVLCKYDRGFFYRMYSDDFFQLAENLKIPLEKGNQSFGNLGFALIDGDHSPEGEMRDISSTAKFLGEKAFVVVDDIHVDFERISKHIEEVFPNCEIRYWSAKETLCPDIIQAYIWKGVRPSDELFQEKDKGNWIDGKSKPSS